MALRHFLKAPFAGDSATPGFEKWIELFSFQWGSQRVVTLKSSKLVPGKLESGPVSVNKKVDAATAEIAKALFGSAVPLEIAAVDEFTGVRVLDLTFTNAVFDTQSFGTGSGDDVVSENVSFQFTRVDGVVQTLGSKGNVTGKFAWFYDQAVAKGG